MKEKPMRTSLAALIVATTLTAPASFAQTNTFPDSGNVGIGTTSPSAKLDVMGHVNMSGRLSSGLVPLSLGVQISQHFVVGFQNELANWDVRGGTLTTSTTGGASLASDKWNLVRPQTPGYSTSTVYFTSPGSVTYEFTGLGAFPNLADRSWAAYLQMRAGQNPSAIKVELQHMDTTWYEIWNAAAPLYRQGLWYGGIRSTPLGATEPIGVRFTLTYSGTNPSYVRALGLYHRNRPFGEYTLPFLHTGNDFTGQNTFAGNVGIGTASPAERLHVNSTANELTFLRVQNTNAGSGAVAGVAVQSDTGYLSAFAHSSTHSVSRYGQNLMGWNEILSRDGSGLAIGTNGSAPIVIGTDSAKRMEIGAAGGVTVTGDLTASGTITGGNIQAKYQDIAEWVPTKHELAAGTVVVLDESAPNHVAASNLAYDTAVAGVISGQPGLVLGEGGEGKTMVATTGRVRVKVDATKGAIAIGDLLVTSDMSGIAMRSEPMELNGRKFHQPGTIIGKALQPLAEGTGEILVLLSLQ
jgi:hypothetical protein